ncbi:desulfoferrodoxin family protein [Hallella colorans]|uniref:Superoxide reductase n=1 Tax=Hallella colorans TaxID=1703337 RepID=A0A2U0U351_9BACT|nr:desulfoferrodoxin family protein [Hallella colorans]PVX51112.1 superoxide reductase [Hallella colorans]
MAKRNDIYKNTKTGSMVEVMVAGELNLDGDWKAMTENTVDAAKEKHVPVIEAIEGGYRVTVGSVEHPMTEEHYIQWIELMTETEVLRKYLTPNDKPVAEFKTDAKKVCAREYCNLHGVWKADL